MTRSAGLAEVTPPRHPISVIRVVLIVAATTVLGIAIGTSLALHQRKIYQGWALIENPGYASHPAHLTKLRAEMVTRDLDLENRWATTFEAAAAIVSSSVELMRAPEGLLVSATVDDPKDAQLIARSVANTLAAPDTEAFLAAKWNGIADVGEAEAKDIATIYQLEDLLNDQAVNAGFTGYTAVLREAAKGEGKAAALAGDEDFARRRSMLESLSRKIGFPQPPGEPILTPHHIIRVGSISTMPKSNPGQLTLQIGRIGGMAVGGLLVLALLRWKPGFMRPEPRIEPARSTPPPQPGPPRINDDPW